MCRGGGEILVGTAVNSEIGELEDEVRELVFRAFRKELTGVVQGVSGKNRYLVRFQDGCEKDLNLNQLTIVILENSLV